MTAVLYRKEREVLKYIIQYQSQYGYSPKLREIADATGNRAVSTIHAIIRNLVDKGYIQKNDGNSRLLKILKKEQIIPALGPAAHVKGPTISLPLMGFIAAGSPLVPYTDPEASVDVASSLLTGKRLAYALQVKGNSMIEDGIFDGDLAIIEKTDVANNGDIVVALVDDNLATLKRFYLENGRVVLRPANVEMDPIYPSTCKIQGVCVAVVRRFTTSFVQ